MILHFILKVRKKKIKKNLIKLIHSKTHHLFLLLKLLDFIISDLKINNIKKKEEKEERLFASNVYYELLKQRSVRKNST
jgi:hypothetical protein